MQGLIKTGIYPEMLFIAMLFLAFLFFSIFNRVGVYPKMLCIAMLFLAFLVAIFNTPSQQEMDYLPPRSCLYGTRIYTLTMP